MSRSKRTVFILCGLLILGGAAAAQLGSILKGGGIAYLVTQFGPEINKAINGLTKTRDTQTYTTKVVPVISGGEGVAVGAVQVAGPRSAVAKVQAVAQLEGNFKQLGVRVRALIPVSTKSVTDIRRVTGVGISGIVDVKL